MNGLMDTGGQTDGRAVQECLRYERSGGLQNNRPIFIPPTESVGGLNKDGCFCLVHVLQSCAVSLHHAARRFGPRCGHARQIHHGRHARGASLEKARNEKQSFTGSQRCSEHVPPCESQTLQLASIDNKKAQPGIRNTARREPAHE